MVNLKLIQVMKISNKLKLKCDTIPYWASKPIRIHNLNGRQRAIRETIEFILQ
jgi:hypothetical protein